MLGQQVAHGLDAGDHAVRMLARAQPPLHQFADAAPLFDADERRQPTIGDDLDAVVGQQQVDEDTVVRRGIPDPQAGEGILGARTRLHAAQDVAPVQRGLHRETPFTRMAGFAHVDRRGDPLHRRCREHPARIGGEQMGEQALEGAGHHVIPITSPPRRHRPRTCRRHPTNRRRNSRLPIHRHHCHHRSHPSHGVVRNVRHRHRPSAR